MRTVVAAFALFLVVAACGDDDPGRANSKPRPLGEVEAGTSRYPESKAGLSTLFEDLVAAIGRGDDAQVDGTVRGFVLVDPDAWFAKTFGADAGKALAGDYRVAAAAIDQLTGLLRELVRDGQTEVVVERFDSANDPAAVGYQALALAKMERPVALYSVRLRAPGQRRGFHLWSFVYQDGGFRWIGKLKALADGAPPVGDDEVDPLERRQRNRRHHGDAHGPP